jgi:hypothetical protein
MKFRFIYLTATALIWIASPGRAQDLEPQRWSHLPTGIHFAGAGYAYTDGNISFNPVLRIEDAKMYLHTFVGKYIQTFDLRGHSVRLDLTQGYQSGDWKGKVDGAPTRISRNGPTDSIVRLSIPLYGAPPLKGADFAEYRASRSTDTIVGAGLAVKLPTGEYYSDKLINLGSNRFTFRPQLGVTHKRGKLTLELTGKSWIFTDNNNFYNDAELENDPLYTLQVHTTYTFRPGLWASAGFGGAYGGESSVDGDRKDDHKENLAWILSAGYPITRYLGAKIAYIGTRSQMSYGADTDSIVFGLSALW